MIEGPAYQVDQGGKGALLRLDRDGSRFDLREVENVGDEIEQVRAGAVYGAREFHLLACQIAFGILRQLLTENQNAVERRPQLVRHVREELRLVLRRQRQFRRLVLDRPASLLDLLVLSFDLGILLRELLRLLRQLLVGLLKLLLLRLQLARELLRLLQQPFGLHGRLDTVEDDADAGRQLFEEGEVRGREILEGGQTEHRLDLPFKDDGKDDEIAGQGLEEDRTDRHRVRGHI